MFNVYGTTFAKTEVGERETSQFLVFCFRIAMLTKRVRPEQADFRYLYLFLYQNIHLPVFYQ